MYVCRSIGMHACLFVCLFVCMYVCVHIYIHISVVMYIYIYYVYLYMHRLNTQFRPTSISYSIVLDIQFFMSGPWIPLVSSLNTMFKTAPTYTYTSLLSCDLENHSFDRKASSLMYQLGCEICEALLKVNNF